jgi:hypothetical protein
MKRLFRNDPCAIRLCLSAIAALVLVGCGSNPSASVSPAGPTAGSATRPASAAAQPAGKATNNAAALAKSAFHAEPQFGRDPFFPELTPKPAAEGGATPLMQIPIVSYLKLAGIWPGKTRPMALINKTPFAQGEEGDVSIVISNQLARAEVQKVNVRCLEIRQDSVLISIEGEQGVKELRIAQGK